MTPKQVVKHFGTVALAAEGLGMTRQIIYYWLRRGRVPRLAQLYVSAITPLKVTKTTKQGEIK
tara:strand:- start:1224 stop:1412 length:189 start_codon:yes stop_codon:yes gene_type:complete